MLKRDTENAEVEQQNQSLPSLFGRLTDELTQMFDPKLESVKGGVRGKRHTLFNPELVGHRFRLQTFIATAHCEVAEPTTGFHP